MKVLRKSLALSFVAAALVAGPEAFAQTPYDGLWNVTIQTRTGSCEPSSQYPLTVLDGRVTGAGDATKPSGRSLSLRIASSFSPLASSSTNVAAARHERRDDAVGADVAISFGASLDRAKTVGAGANARSKVLADCAATSALKFDVPRGALAEHAHLPRQRANPRLGDGKSARHCG